VEAPTCCWSPYLPNDVEKDADSYSNFPILKTNPKLPNRFYLQFQHLYAPILYSFLGLSYYFGDFFAYWSGTYDNIKLHQSRLIDTFIFYGGKLFYAFFFFFVPIYLYGWQGIYLYILPYQLIGSNFLASLFIVSHNADDCEYNYSGNDWAALQVRTAANWSIHSTIWWLVSGGLNFQIEHHLFPGVSHVHYPQISPLIIRTCNDFGVPYHDYKTYSKIYFSHLEGLKKLGNMGTLSKSN